jgi:hypothetical protein
MKKFPEPHIQLPPEKPTKNFFATLRACMLEDDKPDAAAPDSSGKRYRPLLLLTYFLVDTY